MTPEDAVVRRFVLVAVWLPMAFAAIAAVTQLALLPQTPSTIAVHWNASGIADGFAPAWTQPLATLGFGFGVPALITAMTLPALRRGERGLTFRLLGAVAASVSALVCVAFTWTFAMQAGHETSDAPAIWTVLAGSLGVGALVGLAAWALQPRQGTTRTAPTSEPALPLAPHERAGWVQATAVSVGAAVAMVLAVVAVGIGAVVAWVAGGDPALVWVLTGVAVLLFALAATTLAFHVRVDDRGLHVTSFLGIPRFRVAPDDVVSAARVEVDPMGEFGGWGLRVAVQGRRFGVVLRRGEAIEVTRRSGRRFVVTVDDAATGAALLTALSARATARP